MLIDAKLMKCYCYTTWNVVIIIIERKGWVRLGPFFMKLTWKNIVQKVSIVLFCVKF